MDDQTLLDQARAVYKGIHELALQKDQAYWERNQLVNVFAKMAHNMGWPVWLAEHIDKPGEPAWGPEWRTILFVQTPQGQVSWHLYIDELGMFDWAQPLEVLSPWDEHTTKEKYQRLAALTAENNAK